ncbi:MAG: LuxR C-terminal-related transcriptional regulator [Pseudonocardiales bacterium]
MASGVASAPSITVESPTAHGLRVVPSRPAGGRAVVPGLFERLADRPGRVFVGREHQCRLVRQSLAGQQFGWSTAALIAGEAGAGKTALLEQFAATAPGRVLWIRGVESEAALPFAAVADLLGPLRGYFDLVPDVQREALEASLALRSGASTGPLSACAGALTVLAVAGAEQRLLIVVDDLQWVDPESRQILLFVARRLVGERVGMLLAISDQPGSEVPVTDLFTVRLGLMSAAEIRDLVASLGVDVSGAVLAEIVAQTGGNPLAVIETVRCTPAAELQGSGLGFTGPRLSPSLHRVWSAALDAIPERTRTALFVVAASGLSRPSDLEPVLAALGLPLADLDLAQRCGLLESIPGGVRLRSPLVRPILFERTPFATRRAVLRTLAEHVDHLKPWYLAAALSGPDDVVADGLAAAATAARKHSGLLVSSQAWARAAELTVDPSIRAQRLLAAATDAHLAGASDVARGWCNEALALRTDPCFAAEAVLVRGRAHTWLGHPLRAVDDLVRAGDAVRTLDAAQAARLYAEAALPCAVAGRFNDMLAITSRSETAQPPGEQRPLESAVMSAVALALAGRSADARQRLDAANSATESTAGSGPWDLQYLIMLALGRMWTEDFRGARVVLGSVLNAALQAGAGAVVPLALAAQCEMGWWTGDWSSAYADGMEALQRAEALNQVTSVAHALFILGRVHATRGDGALAEEHIHRARREMGSYGMDFLSVGGPSVLGLSALAAADHSSAAHHLDQAWRTARERGLDGTNVVPYGGDLVEAHIRAGDSQRAHTALAWLDARAAATGLAYPAAAAARCHGLLADDLDSARECFTRAATLHLRVEMPFERARTLLCEGETLRRLRRPVAARPPLLEALAMFESIGARPWAARAEVELAATGVRARTDLNAGRASFDALTPQEFQVAQSVAEGLNNVEVASSLFVSRKTVEAHLTRIYRKLGVRSRTELARRLVRHDAPSHRR